MMKKTKAWVDKYYVPLVVSAFLVGVILRLYYLLEPISKLSFDEAVYAVQSLNILKGEWTVFYYNQAYTGTLQAYLSSFLYLLFGVNEIWSKVVPLFFSFAYLVLTYLLAQQAFKNRYISLIALFLASISTSFWLNWSSRSGSGYNEMMVCGQLVFLFALKIVQENLNKKQKEIYAFIIGLASGIGFWIQPTIIYFLIPSGLFLLFSRPFWGKQNRIFDFHLYWALPGLVLGLLPVIYCNLTGCAATVASLINVGSDLKTTPWGSIYNFFALGVPVLVGTRKASETIDYVSSLTWVVLGIYFLSLAFLYFNQIKGLLKVRFNYFYLTFCLLLLVSSLAYITVNPVYIEVLRNKQNLAPYLTVFLIYLTLVGIYFGLTAINWFKNKLTITPLDVFLQFCFILVLVFVSTPPFNGFVVEPRYVSPLYVAFPILLSLVVYKLFSAEEKWSWLKPVGLFTLSTLILSAYVDIKMAPPTNFHHQYKIDKLITYLETEGIKYVYANNDFAYRLMLETNGEIVAVPYDNYVTRQRVPHYERDLWAAPNNQKALVALRDYRMLPQQCSVDYANNAPCHMGYFDGFYIYRW